MTVKELLTAISALPLGMKVYLSHPECGHAYPIHEVSVIPVLGSKLTKPGAPVGSGT